MFQHRHYATIAQVLAKLEASQRTVHAFADLFENDNPRFDRKRFYQAAIMGRATAKDQRTANA